jgi:hypothetical protein
MDNIFLSFRLTDIQEINQNTLKVEIFSMFYCAI